MCFVPLWRLTETNYQKNQESSENPGESESEAHHHPEFEFREFCASVFGLGLDERLVGDDGVELLEELDENDAEHRHQRRTDQKPAKIWIIKHETNSIRLIAGCKRAVNERIAKH